MTTRRGFLRGLLAGAAAVAVAPVKTLEALTQATPLKAAGRPSGDVFIAQFKAYALPLMRRRWQKHVVCEFVNIEPLTK